MLTGACQCSDQVLCSLMIFDTFSVFVTDLESISKLRPASRWCSENLKTGILWEYLYHIYQNKRLGSVLYHRGRR